LPVLVEMTSLVAPAGSLRAIVEPDHPRLAGDGLLEAVSFAADAPLGRALRELERRGLVPLRAGEPAEVAVLDQREGPALWWPWLELAVVQAPGGGRVLAARRAGDPRREVSVPPGWSFPRSASAEHGVEGLAMADRPLRHLRREPGLDRYLDLFTTSEVGLRREHPRVRVEVRAPRGAGGEVRAERVTRWQEIEVGLMFRDSLAPDEGMLFQFDAPRVHGFWTKNTRVALDILFLDRAGTVVNVAERAGPLRLQEHLSAGPVLQVLEVPGGWCAAHGVGAGAMVRVTGPG
jgi:uncharacterized membrane protein (UPF0127 family)